MNTKLLKYILLLLTFVLCGPLKFRKANGSNEPVVIEYGVENDNVWLFDGVGCPFVAIIMDYDRENRELHERKQLAKKLADEAVAFGNGFRSVHDQSEREEQRLERHLQQSERRAVVKEYKI